MNPATTHNERRDRSEGARIHWALDGNQVMDARARVSRSGATGREPVELRSSAGNRRSVLIAGGVREDLQSPKCWECGTVSSRGVGKPLASRWRDPHTVGRRRPGHQKDRAMESPPSVVVPTRDAPQQRHIGYECQVSTPTTTFADRAHAWLQDKEEQHATGELAYHTIVSYRRTVGVIVDALGNVPIRQVGREHLRRMHADNRHRPSVANQALDIVRRILREAEEDGFRERGSAPAMRIRHHAELASSRPAAPRDVLRVYLTCAEVRAGRLPLCHPTTAALFQLVALTGARPSEIRDLEWPCVDLEGDPPVLRLSRHKTARTVGEKTIILTALARGVLVSLRPPAHARWVFPSHVRPGSPYHDISKPWRRVAAAAGLNRTNLRDLRSGLATNAYERGVPVELIQQMLGHRSMMTTLRYTKISPHKVADAYATVQSAVFSRKRR